MSRKYLKRNFWILFSIDIVSLSIVFFSSYWVRMDLSYLLKNFTTIVWGLPLVLFFKLVFLFKFDLYSGMWRYTGIKDFINLIKATTASFCFVLVVAYLPLNFILVSRSVSIIDFVLGIMVLGGVRVSARIYFDYMNGTSEDSGKKRLLIVGAGDAGEKILRDILKNKGLSYFVAGFLDDDKKKIGHKIHGVPVLDCIARVKKIAKENMIDELILATPSADKKEFRRIVDICKASGVKYLIIPSLNEMMSKKVGLSSARKLSYEDLLGRSSVKLDSQKVSHFLTNKVVLVTGAGGSIGSELCRQIAVFKPKKLLLFDIAESPLYHIDMELTDNIPYLDVEPIVGDVKDKEHLLKIFAKYHPEIVFHAAAYKHVPMMEIQPWKAIENNMMGTKSLVEVAEEFAVKNFILISTDKAVNPTSIMGASKKLAELVVLNKNNKESKFSVVRFGNVLGSVGSVIPLFEKQIAKGGPLTVTHPDIVRYFMTIPEASLLVLQAAELNTGGDIFVLDMGKQIKIDKIAREMIRFFGFEPDKDIEVKYIGLRPGEKLYEELNAKFENLEVTSHPKINVVKTSKPRPLQGKDFSELKTATAEQNDLKLRQVVKKILPEYNFKIIGEK